MPHGDVPRPGESGEDHRLQQHQRLREPERTPAMDMVGDDARKRAEREDAQVAAERDDAKEPDRTGDAISKPPHRDLLQPGPHQREPLPDEEQTEVAPAQRAKGPGSERYHDASAGTCGIEAIVRPPALRVELR